MSENDNALLDRYYEVCYSVVDIALRRDYIAHYKGTPFDTSSAEHSRFVAEVLEDYFAHQGRESGLYLAPNAKGEMRTMALDENLNLLIDLERGFVPFHEDYELADPLNYEQGIDYSDDYATIKEGCPEIYKPIKIGNYGYQESDWERGNSIFEFTVKLFEQAQKLAPHVFEVIKNTENNPKEYISEAICVIIKCGFTVEPSILRRYEIKDYLYVSSLLEGDNPKLGVQYLEQMAFNDSGNTNVQAAGYILHRMALYTIHSKNTSAKTVTDSLINNSFNLLKIYDDLKSELTLMNSSDSRKKVFENAITAFEKCEIFEAFQSQTIQFALNSVIDSLESNTSKENDNSSHFELSL
ncbi:hypothetical protein OCF84_21070 (plasmid) [Shewanella xiamenensis]|uniref:Uncharacterized protein n=1 Tax=Shewanella xiamenensis TaxID=332186 RepID=A0ABT6UGJ9_9GAMM|nr:hypothetical protein [Shewanella xiamenensis]MDI5832631.1 hypothetical protein [Shewanella xiamenensis]WHF58012.1 hypothetical protein OCF84_21070 [Shewanella xiamenensis]